MISKLRAFFHFLAGGPFGRTATSPRTKRLKPIQIDTFTQETYWED